MTIIEVKATGGCHLMQSQSHRRACWMPGYIEVPPHLEQAAWDSGGWCDLIIEGGRLVGITPTERPFVPEPEPTTAELVNILLGVTDDG